MAVYLLHVTHRLTPYLLSGRRGARHNWVYIWSTEYASLYI